VLQRLASHQVLDSDLLHSCRAEELPPVLPFLFDTLLEGAAWDAVWPQRTGDECAFVPFSTVMQQQKLVSGAGAGAAEAANQRIGFVPIARSQVQEYLAAALDDMFGAETERLRSAFRCVGSEQRPCTSGNAQLYICFLHSRTARHGCV
jgi:hypothetical protein